MFSLFKSIRGNIFAYLFLLVSIYSFSNYFIINLIVSPSHIAVERQLAEQEMERFTEALLREGEALGVLAHDWSAWDDTYEFVQSRYQEYITSNLPDTTFTNGGLNLLYFFRPDGSLVWSKLLDLETEEEISLTEFPSTGLPDDHPLLHHPRPDSAINGFVKTELGPMLVSSHPIITSENTGPIAGTLIFGRLLTERLMTKLRKQTKVRCRLINLSDPNELATLPINISSLGPDAPYVSYITANKLIVFSTFPDYQGTPEWLLEVHADRLITSQTSELMRFVVFSNIGIGLVIIILFLLLYRYQQRLATSTFRDVINQFFQDKTQGRQKKPILDTFSTDEFSELGQDLRLMIASFEQTDKDQKNIINRHSTSLRQLNNKLVDEIKERLLIERDLHAIQKNLEKQVKKRTFELLETNSVLQREIERRKGKEKELIKHRKRLRSLSSELMEMEDRERRQLATDLHDQIGQSLSAVKMYTDALIASASNKSSKEKLELIADIVAETIQDVRTLTFELSPPILYEIGLHAALDWLAEEFLQKYGLIITSTCDECPKCTTPAFLALIFRTIRELLTNVVRHAKAEKAEVEVRCTGKGVRITVKDNGCGMVKAQLNHEDSPNTGFGLFSIRERINNIGGTVEINSTKDVGTEIILTIPIKEACAGYGRTQQ